MSTQNKKSFLIYIGIIAAILIIINVVSRNWFFRWDLTDNKMYSLSVSSKSVIKKSTSAKIKISKYETLSMLLVIIKKSIWR